MRWADVREWLKLKETWRVLSSGGLRVETEGWRCYCRLSSDVTIIRELGV